MGSITPTIPSASDSKPPHRFTSQGSTAQDLLASQTVGLVHLSDFRKRRAEALEQKEREAGSFGRFAPSSGPSPGPSSGTATPIRNDEGTTTPNERPKKKRKPVIKGKLSFGVDDEEQKEHGEALANPSSTSTPQPSKPTSPKDSTRSSPVPPTVSSKPRLGPNSSIPLHPRALTKSALRTESLTRETLRRDFLAMQEAVRATEIVIPFVFYDGTNIPGGACKIKKGDHVWLFLDRARKLGAESGVNAAGERGGGSRRDWARVGVDDLILVRGEVIVPHHYDVYYFLVNKTLGPNSKPLFEYAATLTKPTAEDREREDYDPISLLSAKVKSSGQVAAADRHLEGVGDDPNLTKVVDRRWYERNKHIFPASVWEEFDPGKTYEGKVRTDTKGNAFFFS